MKTQEMSQSGRLWRQCGGGIRAALLAAWVAGFALAALVMSPPALLAGVIDDFNAAEPGWDSWNPPQAASDPPASADVAAKRLRLMANFTTATSPENPVAHLCSVHYSRDLPVRQGQTLELRTDVWSVLADNKFGCLVTTDAQGGEYVLMLDRNEIALLKRSQSDGLSVAFWDVLPIPPANMVLVLGLRPEGDDLAIEAGLFKISTGETVFHRTVRDTPASDWGVPDPVPHGWQVFGPDVGAPYKGDLKGVGLGMLHDTDGQQGTAQVIFDNFEYRIVMPTQTCVIDDFEHGRKFMLGGNPNQANWEIVGGELRASVAATSYYGLFCYNRTYALPEGEPIEFRLDLISANPSDTSVSLMVDCTGYICPETTGGGYAISVVRNRVALSKRGRGFSWFNCFDMTVAENDNPRTVSLTYTREGDNLRIGVKVVVRDDPAQVLFSKEVVDHPGADAMESGGALTAPPAGPVATVVLFVNRPNYPGGEAVVDNLISSREPVPAVLGIERKNATEATLEWAGMNIVLESDSVQGAWRPCPEPPTLEPSRLSSTVRLRDAGRYFRLVEGYRAFDSFDVASEWAWKTASVVPGGTLCPTWYVVPSESRARILGQGARNADFVLRYWADTALWFGDCVAAVDIIDWGAAMEDAAFGIFLRAVPAQELWFNTTPGLPDQRYAGLLTFKKADNPAESALSITGPGGAVLKEQRLAAVDPDKQYRLRFWAVGDQLTLELFDRDNLGTPLQRLTVTDGRIPAGLDGLYGTKSAGGTYEVWIDQYMSSGATLY